MATVKKIEYTVDPDSLADIPVDEFSQALAERLDYQWPGVEVEIKYAPTMNPARVTLDSDSDPKPYEERARECANEVFRVLCQTPAKKNYLIYRHGSNAANQSMCNKAPVAIVNEAETSDEAERIAAKHLTVYANQFLSAVEEGEADIDDWNAVCEQDALANAYEYDGCIFTK